MQNKALKNILIFAISLIVFTIILWIFTKVAITSSYCPVFNSSGRIGSGGILSHGYGNCYAIFGITLPEKFTMALILLELFIKFVLPIVLAGVSTMVVGKKLEQKNK